MKVLVLEPIAAEGVSMLKKAGIQVDIVLKPKRSELKRIMSKYDAIIIRSQTIVDEEIIDAATRLKAIALACVGMENVDIAYAEKNGIQVINTPDKNTHSAAEHTFAILLSLLRHLCDADSCLKHGKWQREKFMGHELFGKVIGIIGIGHIGRYVAKIAQGFDMKVQFYDPFVSHKQAKILGIKKVSFQILIKSSDIISIHTVKTEATTNMISQKEFQSMKDGVVIINAGRGGIVNEEDLYQAIKKGKVDGAAIDTWEKEPDTHNKLQHLPNVVCTPHIGASTYEAQQKISIAVAKHLIQLLKNKKK